MNPSEIIETQDVEVSCDGGLWPLGHPRVYLHVDHGTGQIQCPYCSRLYVLKEHDSRKAG